MWLFKNTKKILKHNNRMLTERNKELYDRNIAYQYEIKELKELVTKLKFELEDTKGFLQQEKECSDALRKERTKLKREITMLKKKGGLTSGK